MSRVIEKIALVSTRLIGVGSGILFLLFVGYLIYSGANSLEWSMLSPTAGKLFAALIGTIWLISLSIIIATPVGIMTGIYLGVYAKGRIKIVLSFMFELLAAMPSIVIGLFGFAMILALHQILPSALPSLWIAALSVAILILPYIVKATQLGIEEAPSNLKTLAYSSGASQEQVIRFIMLPFAKSHILKGVLLSLARASEDTAVIMLTGSVASFGVTTSILEPFEALPFYIYTTTAEYGSPEELESIFVAAMLLIGLSMLFIGLTNLLNKKENR